jgi:hypothetical protein
MEHVQGVSLDQLLLRFKDGLPGAIAIEVTRQTSLALHVAYNEALGDDGRPMRVIHRDIKPSNVLLSIHGEVKVVDFGIAKGEFEGREADTQSVVMGSRPYMAPERLDGISDSPAVDVYSAGMSLFELLTGRTMSLSINPVTHDQAMNRQLGYLQVPGMAPSALDDLRGVVRRMCAYDRDYRPTSLDVARDLEQCLYAIDADLRPGLEEFARTTVLPIYESRPRITPEDAQTTTEDEFLREVTGQLTGSNPSKTSGVIAWTPYLFAAGLTVMVVLLSAAAAVKAFSSSVPGSPAYVGAATDDGRVVLGVWIPGDATAQIGDQTLPTSGKVRVFPGETLMELYFNDGRTLNCRFEARQDITVRYVVDSDVGGLSVDDSTMQPCNEIRPREEAGTPLAPGSAGPG